MRPLPKDVHPAPDPLGASRKRAGVDQELSAQVVVDVLIHLVGGPHGRMGLLVPPQRLDPSVVLAAVHGLDFVAAGRDWQVALEPDPPTALVNSKEDEAGTPAAVAAPGDPILVVVRRSRGVGGL